MSFSRYMHDFDGKDIWFTGDLISRMKPNALACSLSIGLMSELLFLLFRAYT
jgi:hypothetical protein